jgi:hypothetical protein
MPDAPVVTIVVDGNFGDRLTELASSGPVWIVETPTNRLAVDREWKESPAIGHLEGVTIFDSGGVATPDKVFINVLDTVDLHHSEYSANSPYSEIRVIGTGVTDEIERELFNIGFSVCASDATSFQAKRDMTDNGSGHTSSKLIT